MNDIIHVDNMDKYENVKKLIVEFRQGNDLSVPVDNIKFVKIDGESDAVAPTPTPTPDPEPSGSSWVENFQPTGAVMPIGLAYYNEEGQMWESVPLDTNFIDVTDGYISYKFLYESGSISDEDAGSGLLADISVENSESRNLYFTYSNGYDNWGVTTLGIGDNEYSIFDQNVGE